MEPRQTESNGRFRIEKLEERIAPAHVSLPASPGIDGGPSAAPDQNPHFSGKLRPLPVFTGLDT
jgi:hypothetical protein